MGLGINLSDRALILAFEVQVLKRLGLQKMSSRLDVSGKLEAPDPMVKKTVQSQTTVCLHTF